MKSYIDEYIYQCVSNERNIYNSSPDINEEALLYPIDQYYNNIDSSMNKMIYKTTTYVYKLCIFKFWIHLCKNIEKVAYPVFACPYWGFRKKHVKMLFGF